MTLTIVYQPISAGKIRLWENIGKSFAALGQFGELNTPLPFATFYTRVLSSTGSGTWGQKTA